MDSSHICKGICKNFRVKKPVGKGRYDSGHGLCITCDIWIDHNGCHLLNNKKATADSEGWFCNCCNFRVRQNSRKNNSKVKSRSSHQTGDLESQIDLSYFNKQRAIMIKKIVQCITLKKDDFNMQNFENLLLKTGFSTAELETEFDESIYNIIDLAYTLDPPNKISMIAEFERIKLIIKRVPTKQDIDKHSQLSAAQYDDEFESWAHMLNRLGYDPWYRDNLNTESFNKQKIISTPTTYVELDDESTIQSLEELKNDIQSELKNEPTALKLFDILDQNISKCDKDALERIIDSMD